MSIIIHILSSLKIKKILAHEVKRFETYKQYMTFLCLEISSANCTIYFAISSYYMIVQKISLVSRDSIQVVT